MYLMGSIATLITLFIILTPPLPQEIPPMEGTYTICSWHVPGLDRSTADRHIPEIASILSQCDLAAIYGLRDASGSIVQDLCDALVGYRCAKTALTQSEGSLERSMFVHRVGGMVNLKEPENPLYTHPPTSYTILFNATPLYITTLSINKQKVNEEISYFSTHTSQEPYIHINSLGDITFSPTLTSFTGGEISLPSHLSTHRLSYASFNL
jgi:hypothetical protein